MVSLGRLAWERHGECRTLLDFALHGDASARLFDDAVADGETETRALANRFGREERVEDPSEVGFGDSLAGIAHLEDHRVTFGSGHDSDGASGLFDGVDRVVDQVEQHLLDLGW